MLFFERKQKLSSLLPEKLAEVYELDEICKAIGKEIDAASEKIAAVSCNAFITSAFENGMTRWEQIAGIYSPLNSSLSARRDALVAKLMTKAPINLAVLKGIVEAYMGLEIEIEVSGFYIHIRYRGESRIADLTPLYVTMNEIIPANMIAEIAYKYLIWSELDSLAISFSELDSEQITWADFEKGEWING